jgi:hypothetical protein
MDCAEQQQHHEEVEIMEVPEIDGDLLVELLDAPFADADDPDDEAPGPQLGFAADVFDGWVDNRELNSIHPHHDCEDCGLDDDRVISDFELGVCGSSRSPSPYIAFDDDTQWTQTAEAALGPFIGDGCMGEWYMDGMAMEWEEEEGNGFSFGPYYYGGEGEAGTEQVYGSPLWEE